MVVRAIDVCTSLIYPNSEKHKVNFMRFSATAIYSIYEIDLEYLKY